MSSSNKKILYFTASWCGPCQKIKPVFKALEAKHGSSINFSAIDVDLNAKMASHYKVNSMPTFVFLSDDEEIGRFVGANEEKLKEGVEALLKL
jgi:thioredoxin 1